MPEDYYLVVLPPDAKFEPPPVGKELKLSSNRNFVRILIALGQAVYAITTLYRTQGDQITRFGYAAFGLTVIPYLFMSVMNLIGNLMRPDYPTLYLVESQDMVDAVTNQASSIGNEASTLDEKIKPVDQHTPEHQGTDDNGHDSNDLHQKVDEKLLTQSQTAATEQNADMANQSVIVRQIANKANQNAESIHHDTPAVVQSIHADVQNCTPDNTPAPHSTTTRTAVMYTGTVAKLMPAYEAKLHGQLTKSQDVEEAMTGLSWVVASFLGILVPITIIGIMTHFHKGGSTLSERVWVMLWVVIGGVAGGYVGALFLLLSGETSLSIYCFLHILAWSFCVPAIGGFIVVSKQISSYGNCQHL